MTQLRLCRYGNTGREVERESERERERDREKEIGGTSKEYRPQRRRGEPLRG